MTWQAKVGIGVAIVAIIAALLFIVKSQNDIIQRQKMIEQSFIEQKELVNGITRSQSSLMTKKDLETWAKANKIDLDPIKKDLDTLGASVEGIQTVKVQTPGYKGANLPSTKETPNPDPVVVDPDNPDPFGYLNKRQELKLDEPFGNATVPFGSVGFSAWKENPWDLQIKPREYGVDTVLGVNEDGQHIPYTKVYVSVDGKRQEVKISESKWREVLPENRFRFDPRLYAGMDGGVYFTKVSGAATPNLELSLFSYGKTKSNPEWTFLGFGLGYEMVSKELAIVLTPVAYNIGKPLPLVDNVHLRPTLMATPKGDFGIMLGVGFGL